VQGICLGAGSDWVVSRQRSPAPPSNGGRVNGLFGWVGASIGGALGWWVGDREGLFTAFLVSMVGTGVGLYLGRRMAGRLLD